MQFKCLLSFLFIGAVNSIEPCPSEINSNGYINDIAYLSDMISGPESVVAGKCGSYKTVTTIDDIFDTRLRLYEDEISDKIFIIFRPTQQTVQGGSIHSNRELVQCNFIDNCKGMVMEKFQDAFISMVEKINWSKFRVNDVYVGGHSLGGAFSIFMGVYLLEKYSIKAKIILGIAGPFIGDEEFNQTYLVPLKEAVPDWWQIEDENRTNPSESDLTVEQYNVDYGPKISVFYPAVCKVQIDKLWNSYGMHDLKNYQLAFTGISC